MSGQKHQKWYIQFIDNFDVYLHAKNQIRLSLFPKIFQRYCKYVILGTLDMPGHNYQKLWYKLVRNFDVYLNANNQLYPSDINILL